MNNNPNPNKSKRRLNFNTQQQHRPLKRSKPNVANRGRGRGIGRGRGRASHLSRSRGRGRGQYVVKPKTLNTANTTQPAVQSINANNSNPVNTRKPLATSSSSISIANTGNLNISRTIENPHASTTNTTTNTNTNSNVVTETADQKAARLREQAIKSMKASLARKPPTAPASIVSGVVTQKQIENEQRKKTLPVQSSNTFQQKSVSKAPSSSMAGNTNLAALRSIALRSMPKQKTPPIATTSQPNVALAASNLNPPPVHQNLFTAAIAATANTTSSTSTSAPKMSGASHQQHQPRRNPVQANPAEGITSIPRRVLKSYRTGAKSKDNLSFTTTYFDIHNNPVKTVISTNTAAASSKPTPSTTVKTVECDLSSTPSGTSVFPPSVNLNIPPKIPDIPPLIKTNVSDQRPPVKPRQIDDVRLPLDAPTWSCQFCTYINENNTGTKCSMCHQNNFYKTPVAKQEAPKRQQQQQQSQSLSNAPPTKPSSSTSHPLVAIASSSNIVAANKSALTSLVADTVKPAAAATTVSTPAAVPIIRANITTTSMPKLSGNTKTATSTVPASATTTKHKSLRSPFASTHKKAATNVADAANMDALWAQRDQALFERKQHSHTAGVQHKAENTKMATNVSVSGQQTKPTGTKLRTPADVVQTNAIALTTPMTRSEVVEVQTKQAPLKTADVAAVVEAETVNVEKTVALPPMKECWGLKRREKWQANALETFLKETDEFIKQTQKEVGEECVAFGVDGDCEESPAADFDIHADFEWTKKVSAQYHVEWPHNLDLKLFASAINECTQK